jgi:hypothetical protein
LTTTDAAEVAVRDMKKPHRPKPGSNLREPVAVLVRILVE